MPAEGSKDSFASFRPSPARGEPVMTNLTLLVMTAISLLAATPVAAMSRGHHHYRYAYSSRSYRGDFDRRNTFN